MNDNELKAKFEADAAASPRRYRAILDGCENWSREEMIENLQVFAAAADIADEHLRIERAKTGMLASIGRNLEKIATFRMRTLMKAKQVLDLVVRDVSVFVTDETKVVLEGIGKGIDEQLAITLDPVEWPTT
jgi:hypothetical protein